MTKKTTTIGSFPLGILVTEDVREEDGRIVLTFEVDSWGLSPAEQNALSDALSGGFEDACILIGPDIQLPTPPPSEEDHVAIFPPGGWEQPS